MSDLVYCRTCGKQIHRAAQTCPGCGGPQVTDVSSSEELRSQTAAGLWCFFLGSFGAHWYYLHRWVAGVLSTLFFWTGIPGVVAIVNMLQIGFSSQGEWARKYNGGVLTPPVHGAVKVLAALAPILGVIGFILGMAAAASG